MTLAALQLLVFTAFALFGVGVFVWRVAKATSNRWTGWVAYLAIVCVPTFVVFKLTWAALRVVAS